MKKRGREDERGGEGRRDEEREGGRDGTGGGMKNRGREDERGGERLRCSRCEKMEG